MEEERNYLLFLPLAMEDILYYILIAAGYALYSWLTRKRQPQPDMGTEPPAHEQGAPTKQMTFEELLREITQAKQESRQPQPAEAPVSDYEEEIEDEYEDLEEVELKRERPLYYEDYQKAKNIAFERPSLEETLRLEDVKVNFDRFSVFEQQRTRNLLEEYAGELRNPEGLKKALVLSEILNRKYF